jgi:hypothetical protein
MMRESEVFCSPVETGEKQKYNKHELQSLTRMILEILRMVMRGASKMR